MKKYLLLFIVITIGCTIRAQDRFQRIYPGTTTTDAIKADDGDYYLLESKNRILHIDANGNLLNRKTIDINASSISLTYDDDGALLDDDKSLVVSFIDLDRDSTKWYLGKFDFGGNKIWEISFPLLHDLIISGSEQTLRNYPIIKLDENHYLVCEIPSAQFVNLYKIRRDGELVWQRRVDGSFFIGFRKDANLSCYNDDNFILYNRSNISAFNSEGDSLWHLQSPKSIRLNATYSGLNKLIVTDSHNLTAIDTTGSILWSYEIEDELMSFNRLAEDRYLLSLQNDTSNYQLLFDEFSNTFIRKDYNYKISAIKIYDENNVLAVGAFEKELTYCYGTTSVFLKSDSNFDFDKEIYLVIPNGGEQFSFNINHGFGCNGGIYWLADDVDKVNIYYSTNSGVNWLSIVDNYSNPNNAYGWQEPIKYLQNVLVKIEAADNPSIFDISNSPFEISYNNPYDYISANEIKMWIGNNGSSAHDPLNDDSGLLWPGGEDATVPAVFADGILWGGKINGMVHVNGSTYRHGLIPGAILNIGERDDENKPEYSIYKLKKDWQSLPDGYEKELMQYNYDNWPAEHGAPFNDVNGDGIFTRALDEPKIIGDETLFYVANDLDAERTAFTYGSPPIGLEFQQTLFAYNTPELKDVVFKKVKLINKSLSTITDMYISYWNDDDLGNAGDDFSGCDTLLNLAYTYNGDNDDEGTRHYGDSNYYTIGYGVAPPAIGRVILQGPITESKYDTAIVDGKTILDARNIQMTSHHLYIGEYSFNYPDMGIYSGSEQFYNNFNGKLWNGNAIIDPNTSKPTSYVLSGDPVLGTGWYEGDGWPGGPWVGNREAVFASGPFEMMPGDAQEVVYAIFMARGSDNLNSITKLKEKAAELHEWWGNDIAVSVNNKQTTIPETYSLSQNYPNPFNPTTTIEYSIPSSVMLNSFQHQDTEIRQLTDDFAKVRLVIYDILGRQVATLVNTKQKPGSYKVEWDATNYSSGIYFYKLAVTLSPANGINLSKGRTNDFVKTNKMILVK